MMQRQEMGVAQGAALVSQLARPGIGRASALTVWRSCHAQERFMLTRG